MRKAIHLRKCDPCRSLYRFSDQMWQFLINLLLHKVVPLQIYIVGRPLGCWPSVFLDIVGLSPPSVHYHQNCSWWSFHVKCGQLFWNDSRASFGYYIGSPESILNRPVNTVCSCPSFCLLDRLSLVCVCAGLSVYE